MWGCGWVWVWVWVSSPPQGISMCGQGVGLQEGPLSRAENRYPEQGASVVRLHDVPPGSPSLGWVPDAFCLADAQAFNTLMQSGLGFYLLCSDHNFPF